MDSYSTSKVKAGLVFLVIFSIGRPAVASIAADPLITPAPHLLKKLERGLAARSFLGQIAIDCSSPAGGTLPLVVDCLSLSSQIRTSSTTYSLAPGTCASATYGTCVGGICALCSQQNRYDSTDFSDALAEIRNGCLNSADNEVGTAQDTGNEDEILFIMEYNEEEELPPYSCPNPQ